MSATEPRAASSSAAAQPCKHGSAVEAHIFVSGKVQGVFYRKYTHMEASKLRLKGWVRNLPDGRVEIVAQGPAENVNVLASWCRRGSPKAKVSGVDISLSDVLSEQLPFWIDRSTGDE